MKKFSKRYNELVQEMKFKKPSKENIVERAIKIVRKRHPETSDNPTELTKTTNKRGSIKFISELPIVPGGYTNREPIKKFVMSYTISKNKAGIFSVTSNTFRSDYTGRERSGSVGKYPTLEEAIIAIQQKWPRRINAWAREYIKAYSDN